MRISDWSSDVCSSDLSGWRAPGAALPLNASAANCTADGPAGAATPAACAWASAGRKSAMQTAIVIPAQAGIHERRSRRLSGKAGFMDSRLRGNDRKDDSPRIAALLHAKSGGVGLAQQDRKSTRLNSSH